MLANLLPGVREIRAPLAAGYIWLVFSWLLLEPLPSRGDAEGLLKSTYALADAVTPVGVGIALTFGAYVFGSLSESITQLPRRVLRNFEFSTQTGIKISLLLDERLNEIERRLRRISLPLDAFMREHVDSRPGAGMSTMSTAMSTAMSTVLSPGVFRELDSLSRYRDLYSHGGQRPFGVRYAELPGRGELFFGISNNLDLITTRLLGDQAELFSAIDRKRAEAEFRFAVASPLLALIVFLGVRENWFWLIAIIAVALLYGQGVGRLWAATELIVDALSLGRVDAPVLERLARLADEVLAAYDARGDPDKTQPLPAATAGSAHAGEEADDTRVQWPTGESP